VTNFVSQYVHASIRPPTRGITTEPTSRSKSKRTKVKPRRWNHDHHSEHGDSAA
jgi:hypothetical protein